MPYSSPLADNNIDLQLSSQQHRRRCRPSLISYIATTYMTTVNSCNPETGWWDGFKVLRGHTLSTPARWLRGAGSRCRSTAQ
eukprot:scaffold77640_cov35-Prasinocladus_malaysianus.AAC.2